MVIEKRHTAIDGWIAHFQPHQQGAAGLPWGPEKKRVGKKEYEHTIQNRMRLRKEVKEREKNEE